MRLNHFISNFSKFSRRESDRLILEGKVKINRDLATIKSIIPKEVLQNLEMGKQIERFKVFINGEQLKLRKESKFSAIVYHKPKGELVSKNDPMNRKLIFHSLSAKFSSFMPVGRLDFSSEGLLILSDNKEIINALMHSKLKREYILKIDSKVSKEMMKAMSEGLILEDASKGAHEKNKLQKMSFAPMEFNILKSSNFSKLKVKLTEGKNRELRRFFAHFNANILDLRRVSFGFIHLNALPVGKVRFFTKEEYKKLKEFLKEKTTE